MESDGLRVAISGGFDPVHEGHMTYMKGARILAGFTGKLYVLLNPDEDMVKKKRTCYIPYEARAEMVRYYLRGYEYFHRYPDSTVVVKVIDKDGTCAHTLWMVKPHIFGKGGDRRSDLNMPSNELQVCSSIGCKIQYGLGDKVNSSHLAPKVKELV